MQLFREILKRIVYETDAGSEIVSRHLILNP